MRNLVIALFSVLALPAMTQAADDPPGRVARLSHVEGQVSMAPAGTQEWSEAVLNRPLTSEDRLWVDTGGRAELQVGSATVHLDSSTEFAFVDLDDDAMTMKLTEGRATVRVERKREHEAIEIATPNATVALLEPGEYHVEVDTSGEATVVKTRSGAAEVSGEGKSYTVRANEMGVFHGADTLEGDISRVGPRTAFENWANDRARRNERSASSRYVGEGVIGYEDLDDDGTWVHEPEYGYVWQPTYVVAGWAPYRFGRWAWVSPWGWTWIDDARWGFAPFHYGRWAYVRQRWCWVPGPRHVHAVYAPALVGWVGGPHVSVSLSFGAGVGWFPLGPREVYVPGYWHSHRYIQRVNVSNTVIVNNTYIDNAYRGRYRDFGYRYRDRPDAVTVVERERFVRGRPVGGHFAHVGDAELRRWGHDARPPAIAPERESLTAGQPRASRPWDQTRGTRSVVDRRELPSRVSFDTERRAIDANGGRPVARTALIDSNSNPKAHSDIRIPHGRLGGAERLREADASAGSAPRIERRAPAREPAIERMPAVEHDGRGAVRHSGEAVRSIPEARQRQPQRELRESQPRAWQPRDSQRSERDARRFEPATRDTSRSQRSFSQPSFSQPERQAQPRFEQRSAPQPRASAPERSHGGGGNEGRSSNHMRGGDRGGGPRDR